MEAIVSVLERAGRYLSLIRPMDVLDVAIIAYLVYKILCLVRSTRAENILKGVAIFLVALWLSSPAALNLRGVNYILSHMVEWGVLALIILFQPEIRQLLEKVGSRNIRLLRIACAERRHGRKHEQHCNYVLCPYLFHCPCSASFPAVLHF